jgi:hypothetical protein
MGIRLEGDEAVEFFKAFNLINQDFKKVESEFYFVDGRKILSMGPELMFQTTGEISEYRNYKKVIDILEESDELIAIESAEFFAFNRDYKNEVTAVEIRKNEFRVETSIPGITYRTVIDSDKKQNLRAARTIEDSITPESWSKVFTSGFSYDLFTEMKEVRAAFDLIFGLDTQRLFLKEKPDEDHITIKFNEKFVLKMLKTSVVTMNVYQIDETTFVLEVVTDNKKYIAKQYFKFLDMD